MRCVCVVYAETLQDRAIFLALLRRCMSYISRAVSDRTKFTWIFEFCLLTVCCFNRSECIRISHEVGYDSDFTWSTYMQRVIRYIEGFYGNASIWAFYGDSHSMLMNFFAIFCWGKFVFSFKLKLFWSLLKPYSIKAFIWIEVPASSILGYKRAIYTPSASSILTDTLNISEYISQFDCVWAELPLFTTAFYQTYAPRSRRTI